MASHAAVHAFSVFFRDLLRLCLAKIKRRHCRTNLLVQGFKERWLKSSLTLWIPFDDFSLICSSRFVTVRTRPFYGFLFFLSNLNRCTSYWIIFLSDLRGQEYLHQKDLSEQQINDWCFGWAILLYAQKVNWWDHHIIPDPIPTTDKGTVLNLHFAVYQQLRSVDLKSQLAHSWFNTCMWSASFPEVEWVLQAADLDKSVDFSVPGDGRWCLPRKTPGGIQIHADKCIQVSRLSSSTFFCGTV